MKKYIFLLIAVGIFISPAFSHAAVYYNGMENTTSTFLGTDSGSGGVILVSSQNLFTTPYAGVIPSGTSFQFNVWLDQATNNGTVLNVTECDSANYVNCNTNLASIPIGTLSGGTYSFQGTITGSTTVASTAGKYLIVAIYRPSGAANHMGFYGSGVYTTSTYAGGVIQDWNFSSGGFWGCLADSLTECTSTPPTETISFAFPENGTTTAPFDNMWLNFGNLETSTLYGYRVDYDWIATIDGPINTPVYGSGLGNILLRQGALIPYQTFLGFNFNLPRGVEATAKLFKVSDCTDTCLIIASTSVLFYQDTATTTYLYINPHIPTSTASSSDGTFVATTTPYTGGPITGNPWVNLNSDASTTLCTKPSNVLDVGGGLTYGGCQILVALFVPPAPLQNYIQQDIDVTKTRFPFSLVYQFASTTQNALAQNSSSAPEYQTLALTFPAAMGQTTTSITIASPSILTDAGVPSTLKDTFFEAMRKILWLSTAIGAVMIPFM